MDDRETATAREGATVLDNAESAQATADHASVGRASASTVAPPTAVPDGVQSTPAVYRAGDVQTAPSDPGQAALPRRGTDLPTRIPGQTRAGVDSPWSAFEPPRQRPAADEQQADAQQADDQQADEPRVEASGVARACASVPGVAPVSPADVVEVVRQSVAEPRTYRAGDVQTATETPAGAPPAEPPPPPQPPEPVEPPAPPQPPEPVEPPAPPSPPGPAEPPPGPSPFPSPTPVPTPPRPVPPEPPTPQPEPGPPIPPQPPVPQPPVPPGPAPVPPFPPPPPAIDEEVPAPSLPTWPPSRLSGSAPARPHGTVYGGSAVTGGTLLSGPLEYSGSLTGHILSQGTDTPPPQSRTTRVVVIMTVVMTTLVILGLILAVFARNALLSILTGR